MTPSLANGRFLITGGTGSFGQTMVDRLLSTGAEEVRVLSRDESKQDAMRLRLRDDRVRYYVGDVRDFDAVSKASRGVQFVFHAAALKQVPSCEFFPLEAVRTNILGSANVADAAVQNGVEAVVFLSTDKAVYPVNAMGMSKGLMEKVAQAHTRNNPGARTRMCIVRYGNVMCSRGSVIPLFLDQIGNGVPLTVTDPEMTRFLMSLPESVELVEHAFQHGRSGDIFIKKAPACTIGDLATAMCNLFEVPAKIEVLGIRHGEKLHETLASQEELARAEDLGQFLRVPVDSRDLNYSLYFEEGDARRHHPSDYNSHNAERLDVTDVMGLLDTLPEVRARLNEVMDLAGAGRA
ncbi:polysaccharide biosynthesis protein [Micromonospora sp. 4G55]|uniref:polysaccharide biosynthesis protein n=1 Tax=Micromonospora sp. 4G55 TaxID=2806102 RepID=UPI001A5DD694|nr:polysaccharide biosynthesis protein [Micromonospora sp. 4G55]MBM0255911.1 polysaccharide biosynthesis protein [Micromonospora sp. 4G55]